MYLTLRQRRHLLKLSRELFSILKRGVIGTYHHWSGTHMRRYLAELDFRYSIKNDTDKEPC
jgi:hypothetical protein